MSKNVLNTDLTGKVAVVTGAGGVLCSYFAKVLARAGAKVALLDINEEAAGVYAQEIVDENGDQYQRIDGAVIQCPVQTLTDGVNGRRCFVGSQRSE